MNHTTNYQLSQWEATDPVQRADFNADNAKIDAALGALAGRIEYGTYVGNGRYGQTESGATVLRPGFRPKILLVWPENSDRFGLFLYPSEYTTVHCYGNGIMLDVKWTDDGLRWWCGTAGNCDAECQLNKSGGTYYYLALR